LTNDVVSFVSNAITKQSMNTKTGRIGLRS